MLQVTQFYEPTKDKGFHVFVTEVCNGARPSSKRANFRFFFFSCSTNYVLYGIFLDIHYYASRRFYSRSFFLSIYLYLSLSLSLMTLRRLGRALSGTAAGASTRSYSAIIAAGFFRQWILIANGESPRKIGVRVRGAPRRSDEAVSSKRRRSS